MDTIIKTYSFKLKTNKKQEATFTSWIASCRLVYNLSLDTRQYAWKSHKLNLSKFDLIKQLPSLKKEFDWLSKTPSQALQNAIERMDTSYKNFFRGNGYPKWAKKEKYNSVTIKQGVKINNNKIFMYQILAKRFKTNPKH